MFCDMYSQASWRLRKLETEIWRSPVTTNSWLSPYPTLMKLRSWIARAGAELAKRSVRVLGQNRADVRVGRVDRPPGDGLGPRRESDYEDHPEHPKKPRHPRPPLAEQHRNPPCWEGMHEDVIKAWYPR